MAKRNKFWVVLTIFFILVFGGIFLKYLFKDQRPNIILVTLDALRPDHLGCYGYPRNTSPNIDKLAGEGIIFDNAISHSTHTAPAMTSILTGLYPDRARVFEFGDKIFGKDFTLSCLLKNNGYATAFFSSHVSIASIKGFDDSFDTFYSIWTFRQDKNNKSLKVTEINNRITQWLKLNRNKKFFLWVHYLEPHYPMNPPVHYKNMFAGNYSANAAIRVPVSKDPAFGFGGIPLMLAETNGYRQDLNYYINLYDAAIRYADDCIGDLIDELKNLGLDRKTIVIISSDHGESLGEHGEYFTHGFNLYDELIKVPLVVRFCSFEPASKRIDTQVGLVDLMPTILELTGTKEPLGIEGRSLMPSIRGDSSCSDRYLLGFTATNKLAVRTNNWKLIYDQNSKQYELYDLKNDPQELNNLVFKEREQFKLLKNKLDSRLKQIQYDPRKKNKVILDEESQQRLRSLGYLG